MLKSLLQIALFSILPNAVTSQVHFDSKAENAMNSGFTEDLRSDINSVYAVGKGFLESTFHFTSEDLIQTGFVVSAIAVSFTLDNSVRAGVGKTHSRSMDSFIAVGEKFGNLRYAAALTGVLYFGGHLVGNSETRETGLILFETLLLNAFVTEGLKIALGRSRPYVNEGHAEILELGFNGENHSIPSGHTSTAFAIATVLSRRIENSYASIGLYSLACLTAYQRIYTDRHWVSDAVLGAALGIGIGLKVIELHSQHTSEQSMKRTLRIFPHASSLGYGLGFSLAF